MDFGKDILNIVQTLIVNGIRVSGISLNLPLNLYF
jgi:hypothetical protein